MIAVWLIEPVKVEATVDMPSDEVQAIQLGGLDNIKLIKKGTHHYALAAQYAREAHLAVGAGITTTLATYYELYAVSFDADLNGIGHARFNTKHGKLDVLMQTLRLDGPVSITFDLGYVAKAKHIDIDLLSGQVKPVEITMNIHGNLVPVGTRKWQIK